jgi:hypothetical protein
MHTLEHILEKGSSPVNEDRLLICGNLFGVFDGATSLADTAAHGLAKAPTGGALAADIAQKTFSANHYPLTCLATEANTAISRRMAAQGIRPDRPDQVWSTSAAVVRLKNQGLEWFRTGDAQVLLVYTDGSYKALGTLVDHDYPTLAMMKSQADNTLNNPALRRQVLKVRKGMNKTYGVLNGDAQADRFFSSGLIPLDHVASVLLFTDGLTLPSQTPTPRPDFTPLVRAYTCLGLSGLHKKIRDMENTDKSRKKYPRFKCHDDIAAVAITLTP